MSLDSKVCDNQLRFNKSFQSLKQTNVCDTVTPMPHPPFQKFKLNNKISMMGGGGYSPTGNKFWESEYTLLKNR